MYFHILLCELRQLLTDCFDEFYSVYVEFESVF